MRRLLTLFTILITAGVGWLALASATPSTYAVEATAIEGCSCPLFCSCYYNAEPSGGHMCQFNNAYRFSAGSHWGDVDLSGAKVWFSGDLGSHFGDGQMEWLVVTHDRASTPEQRAAIGAWAAVVFPVQWSSVSEREDDIAWEVDAKSAHAEMASGTASLHLERVIDPHGKQALVLNTPYWGSAANDGFELAHATHAFNGGEHAYSFERRNGFVITFRNDGEVPANQD